MYENSIKILHSDCNNMWSYVHHTASPSGRPFTLHVHCASSIDTLITNDDVEPHFKLMEIEKFSIKNNNLKPSKMKSIKNKY